MAVLSRIWSNQPRDSEAIVQEDIKTMAEELDALKAQQAFLQRKLKRRLRTWGINARKHREKAEALFLDAEMVLHNMKKEHKATGQCGGVDQKMDNMTILRSSDNGEDAPVIVVEASPILKCRSLNKSGIFDSSHLPASSPYIPSVTAVKWATQDLSAIHIARIAVPCLNGVLV
jgi:hypothetical protein